MVLQSRPFPGPTGATVCPGHKNAGWKNDELWILISKFGIAANTSTKLMDCINKSKIIKSIPKSIFAIELYFLQLQSMVYIKRQTHQLSANSLF